MGGYRAQPGGEAAQGVPQARLRGISPQSSGQGRNVRPPAPNLPALIFPRPRLREYIIRSDAFLHKKTALPGAGRRGKHRVHQLMEMLFFSGFSGEAVGRVRVSTPLSKAAEI